MWIVKIKGPSRVSVSRDFIDTETEITVDENTLKHLEGVECQEDFTEYIRNIVNGDGKDCSQYFESGFTTFEYNSKTGNLDAVCTYTCKPEIDELDLDVILLENLAEYTQGQWSDGIGECFEQEPCNTGSRGEEYYISMWYPNQKITTVIEQDQPKCTEKPLYRVTWVHEVTFNASDDEEARLFWEDINMGDLNGLKWHGMGAHDFVEERSFECVSDDYRAVD
jgi:hypothetical protein